MNDASHRWVVLPLKDTLASVELGGNYKNSLRPSEYPLMKMGNLARGSFDISKIEFVHGSEPPSEKHRLKQGDVLFNTRNTLDLVGKVAIWKGELHRSYFNSNLLRLNFDPNKIESNYLANYILNSRDSIIKLRAIATGTTSVAAIYTRDLMTLPILVPPLMEQKAIARALSDADALIEGMERLIAKKRLIKQGAMQDLLTAKRRLPGYSREWMETTFGQCFKFLRTGSASRSQLGAKLGVGYIHYGDIHGMKSAILDLSRTHLPEIGPRQVATLSRVQDGDLVIADASEDIIDIGKSVEVMNVGSAEVVAGLHTLLLRGNPEIVADGFKAYIQFLRDVRTGIESIATGSSVYGISKRNLARLKFWVPPVDEQAAIGKLLSDMEGEIQTLQTRLQKAEAVKEGMMQNLLTGRIRLV